MRMVVAGEYRSSSIYTPFTLQRTSVWPYRARPIVTDHTPAQFRTQASSK